MESMGPIYAVRAPQYHTYTFSSLTRAFGFQFLRVYNQTSILTDLMISIPFIDSLAINTNIELVTYFHSYMDSDIVVQFNLLLAMLRAKGS